MVHFTASGYGYTNSNTYVEFIINVNGSPVGGANEKVGEYSSWSGISMTTWALSFSRNVTVNPNVTNNITVQYRCASVSGTAGIVINGASNDATHATLSAIFR
jgi:hypothetical protein